MCIGEINIYQDNKLFQSLLTDPNTKSPANAEAANKFDSNNFMIVKSTTDDREGYLDCVRECVINSWIMKF